MRLKCPVMGNSSLREEQHQLLRHLSFDDIDSAAGLLLARTTQEKAYCNGIIRAGHLFGDTI